MPRREFNLTDLNGVNSFTINGVAAGDFCGYFASSVEDINEDDIDDIIIGAYFADPGGRVNAGQSYIVFGHRGSWSSVLELSSLDGSTGIIINGVSAGDQSGLAVSSAGDVTVVDVNGDGYGDTVIGASGLDSGGQSLVGGAHVVFGRSDGWPRSLSLSSLSGTNGFTLYGENADDGAGYLVSSAGE